MGPISFQSRVPRPFRSILIVPILISTIAWPALAQSAPASPQQSAPPAAAPAQKPAAPEESAKPETSDAKSDAKPDAKPGSAPMSPAEARQAQLVADTKRLYELAQELQAEVAKSNKNQLSLDVVKKAAEVEKLAKSLKERMKTTE